jgi:hypothetical protein
VASFNEGSFGNKVEEAAANIAAIFHWSIDAIFSLSMEEFLLWHNLAIEKYNQMNGIKDK